MADDRATPSDVQMGIPVDHTLVPMGQPSWDVAPRRLSHPASSEQRRASLTPTTGANPGYSNDMRLQSVRTDDGGYANDQPSRRVSNARGNGAGGRVIVADEPGYPSYPVYNEPTAPAAHDPYTDPERYPMRSV